MNFHPDTSLSHWSQDARFRPGLDRRDDFDMRATFPRLTADRSQREVALQNCCCISSKISDFSHLQ